MRQLTIDRTNAERIVIPEWKEAILEKMGENNQVVLDLDDAAFDSVRASAGSFDRATALPALPSVPASPIASAVASLPPDSTYIETLKSSFTDTELQEWAAQNRRNSTCLTCRSWAVRLQTYYDAQS